MDNQPSKPKEAEKLTGDALTIAFLKANLEELRMGCMITVAMTNPNVMSYMEHWEGRTEKAEALVEKLKEALKPFAEAADTTDANDDYSSASIWEHPSALDLTIGDLRRARRAYGQAPSS